MNILHAMLGEHGPIRHQLDALRLAAPRLSDDELRVATLGLAEAIESHAHLEDELVFEPLARSGRMPMGPVEAMRAEHDEIERLLGQILAPAAAPGGADAQRTAARMIEIVRHHFGHEENVLFPLAATVLDEQRLSDLGAEWAARRGIELRSFSSSELQAFGARP
jgi:hemerythrin-like domain-containing protein